MTVETEVWAIAGLPLPSQLSTVLLFSLFFSCIKFTEHEIEDVRSGLFMITTKAFSDQKYYIDTSFLVSGSVKPFMYGKTA